MISRRFFLTDCLWSQDIIGQKMYDVQQKGIAGAPKRVKVGVTQMGISVFDENSVPFSNIIFQMMTSWEPDKKERGVTIAMKPKGTVYFKTTDCVAICKEMTSNKETLDAAALMKGSASTEDLAGAAAPAAAAAEEGVPPAGAAADAASPAVRPPREDEEQI